MDHPRISAEAECAEQLTQVMQQAASLMRAQEQKNVVVKQLPETEATLSQSQIKLQRACEEAIMQTELSQSQINLMKENVELKSMLAVVLEDFGAKQSDLRRLVDETREADPPRQ